MNVDSEVDEGASMDDKVIAYSCTDDEAAEAETIDT